MRAAPLSQIPSIGQYQAGGGAVVSKPFEKHLCSKATESNRSTFSRDDDHAGITVLPKRSV